MARRKDRHERKKIREEEKRRERWRVCTHYQKIKMRLVKRW